MIAQLGSGSVAHVSPRAVPVNFHLVSATDDDPTHDVNPRLEADFSWDSSTGKYDDLKGCYVQEYVSFPTTNNDSCPSDPTIKCYFPPSPPWIAKGQPSSAFANPTVSPPPGDPAELGANYDLDFLDNLAFVQPYSVMSFTGTQFYQYQCDNSGSWKKLYGPASINYSMYKDQYGTWSVTISRSDTDKTSYYVIP